MYRNEKDPDGKAAILGDKAEHKFKQAIIDNGIEIKDTTNEENKYKHTDFYIRSGLKNWTSVDVKAMKRLNRSLQPQDEYIWIELMNPYNYKGWVFGEQKLIAFEMQEGFYIVRRVDLVKLIIEKFGIDTIKSIVNKNIKRADITNTTEIRYLYKHERYNLTKKIFRRKDYNDYEAMIFLTKDDIIKILKAIIKTDGTENEY